MASGQTIFPLSPKGASGPGSLFARLSTIEDASTPTTIIPILRFDPTTSWHMDWHYDVPSHYDGGGFTISWKGGTDNTSVGTLILQVRILTLADAVIMTGDLGVDTQTAVSISDTPPATPQDKLNFSATGALSHANAGSPSPGDPVIIRATRDVADTNTGFLQLAKLLILET